MKEKSTEVMKEQLKKGYLKLAILYTLLKGPLHGYEMIKRIKENTFGLLTPTAGSLYPALKELEADGFIKGRWCLQKRRMKVYMITDEGKEAFREVIEKHFSLASAIRGWLLKQLAPVHYAEENKETPELMQRAIRIILLNESIAANERMIFLKDFKEKLQQINRIINNLISSVDKRIEELKEESKNFE